MGKDTKRLQKAFILTQLLCFFPKMSEKIVTHTSFHVGSLLLNISIFFSFLPISKIFKMVVLNRLLHGKSTSCQLVNLLFPWRCPPIVHKIYSTYETDTGSQSSSIVTESQTFPPVIHSILLELIVTKDRHYLYLTILYFIYFISCL